MLHISSISTLTRQSLCALLDTEDKLGRDWCLLAVRMGLIDKVPKLEGAKRGQSQMGKLLDEWQRQPASSIGKECRLSTAVTPLIKFPPSIPGDLVRRLKDIGREDAVSALISGCPLYRIKPSRSKISLSHSDAD